MKMKNYNDQIMTVEIEKNHVKNHVILSNFEINVINLTYLIFMIYQSIYLFFFF